MLATSAMHRCIGRTKNAIAATSARYIFPCLPCKRDSLVEKNNTKPVSKVQTAELSERRLTCATAAGNTDANAARERKRRGEREQKAPDASSERTSASDHETHKIKSRKKRSVIRGERGI